MSVGRSFAIILAAGLLAGCGTSGPGPMPTLALQGAVRHVSAASAAANTPEGRGLGNQKWTDCQNKHEDRGAGNGGLDNGNDKDGTAYPNAKKDGGYPPGLNKGGACSTIDLLAPLSATMDTSSISPGSSTASATLKLSAVANVPCAPVSVGSAQSGLDPDRGSGDDKHGSTPATPAPFVFPLNAAPFSTGMEVTTSLGGLTLTDPCAVIAPAGIGNGAIAGPAPVGYYIILVSSNAAGNMAMTGAMSLTAVNGNQLTFAPLPGALVDLPAGFEYAFYLARVNAAGAIELPASVHGGV